MLLFGGTAQIPGPAGRVTDECPHTEDWRNQEMLQVIDWQMQGALDAPIPSSGEIEKPQKKGALPRTLRVRGGPEIGRQEPKVSGLPVRSQRVTCKVLNSPDPLAGLHEACLLIC